MATSSIRNDPPDPRDTDLRDSDSHDRLAARIAIVEQHVRLENEHDLEGVLGTFGDTARYDDEPWGEHFNGRDGVRQFYEQLMKALPDLHGILHTYGQSRLARRQPDSRRDGGATKTVPRAAKSRY